MDAHWFWLVLTMACISWYLFVTFYVAVKGFADIRGMLARLQGDVSNDATTPTDHR